MHPWQDLPCVAGWRSAHHDVWMTPSTGFVAPAPSRAAGGDEHAAIAGVIELMRERAGIDFADYRQATIARRIRNRMIAAGVDAWPDYLARLRADPAEAALLLERLTIKVSRFYRNASTFEHLARVVIPRLALERGAALRIWCAGCGRGEEAYSLAMLLHEAGVAGSVLATDLDPTALRDAAAASYTEAALDELPPALRQRHLEPLGDGARPRFRVAEPIRRRVAFAVHDVLTMPPPEPGVFDLVSCRNVVIYFAAPAQRRVFRTLAAALAPAAFLCIGEAEWPDAELAASLLPSGGKTQVFQLGERS